MNYSVRQIILIVALVFSAGMACAQDGGKADSLFRAGAWKEAALAWEKVYFSEEDGMKKNMALLKKSQCYKNAGNYQEEILNLYRVNENKCTDSMLFVVRYELLLAHYLETDNAHFVSAYTQLMNICSDTAFARKARYLCVLTLVKMNQYEEAKKHFSCLLAEQHLPADSLQLFEKYARVPYKSERKARNLSLIFPGAGQLYAGKIFHGMISTILVAGSVAYTVFAVSHGFYASSFFTGFGWGMRFYTGGTKYATRLVRESNEKKKKNSLKKLERLVLNCTK